MSTVQMPIEHAAGCDHIYPVECFSGAAPKRCLTQVVATVDRYRCLVSYCGHSSASQDRHLKVEALFERIVRLQDKKILGGRMIRVGIQCVGRVADGLEAEEALSAWDPHHHVPQPRYGLQFHPNPTMRPLYRCAAIPACVLGGDREPRDVGTLTKGVRERIALCAHWHQFRIPTPMDWKVGRYPGTISVSEIGMKAQSHRDGLSAKVANR